MNKKRLANRTTARRRRIGRDPFGRLALALSDYLDSIGWAAVVVGDPVILGEEASRRFQFLVTFTGGRRRAKDAKA